MSTEKKTLRLSALDTLFFRESRPFDAIGGSELASVFPPPPRTVLGVVRSAIGDALGADWRRFHDLKETYELPDGRKLYSLIGYGDELGALELDGIWLSLNGERLYPAPRFLLHNEIGMSFDRLRIGAAMRTNVGTVRLPEASGRGKEFKPLESAWLTRAGLTDVLKDVLRDGVPNNSDVRKPSALFAEEPRLGIARDNTKRTAETGLLYQTCHVRPKAGLTIEADISGLDGIDIENHIVRLGGEGRMANITSVDRPDELEWPKVKKDTQGLILVLLTSARFNNEHGNWLPSGFSPAMVNGVNVWQGRLKGIALTLHASVIGKAQREGGWDMAKHKPRAVQSLIPQGSGYYCTVNDRNITTAITALHGKQIGEDNKFGRGVIVCGLWNRKEFCTDHPGESA